MARRLERSSPGSVLNAILDSEAVLVPMPRAGFLRKGDLWPALRIAEALVDHGLASRVAPIIFRTRAVRRSSISPGSSRLWPDQHYDSMGVEPKLGKPPSLVVLVDDVVTRGATLLGAAARLTEVFPAADLLGFAMVRTIKPTENLKSIEDPRHGVITWKPGWIERDP
jgi:hypothetical protein